MIYAVKRVVKKRVQKGRKEVVRLPYSRVKKKKLTAITTDGGIIIRLTPKLFSVCYRVWESPGE